MSFHIECHTCRPLDNSPGPRSWRFGCDECAASFVEFHNTQTGHEAEIRVYETVSVRELRDMMRRVG